MVVPNNHGMRAVPTTSVGQSKPQTPGTFQTFRALRHRDFRLLWIGLAVSAVGTWIQIVAQSLLVLKITHGIGIRPGHGLTHPGFGIFPFRARRRERRRSSR
jgi:hypothetical protein